MFHDYMTINPSIEIYLIDLKGYILSFSADPGIVKRKRVSLEPVHAFLAGDDAYPCSATIRAVTTDRRHSPSPRCRARKIRKATST